MGKWHYRFRRSSLRGFLRCIRSQRQHALFRRRCHDPHRRVRDRRETNWEQVRRFETWPRWTGLECLPVTRWPDGRIRQRGRNHQALGFRTTRRPYQDFDPADRRIRICCGQSVPDLLGGACPWSLARRDAEVGSLIERMPLDLTDNPECSAFSPDAQRLAIASMEGSITLWNPATGRREGELDKAPGKVDSVGFSADLRHLLIHDLVRGWTIWDLPSGHQVPFPSSELHQAIFTPSGELFGASGVGDFLTWDPVAGRSKTYPNAQFFRPLYPTVSANGRVLAVVDPNAGRIHLWSADTFDLKKHLPENSYCGGSLALTPDGKTLAAAGPERTVRLWDVATGEEALTFDIDADRALTPLFSPNGRNVGRLHR